MSGVFIVGQCHLYHKYEITHTNRHLPFFCLVTYKESHTVVLISAPVSTGTVGIGPSSKCAGRYHLRADNRFEIKTTVWCFLCHISKIKEFYIRKIIYYKKLKIFFRSYKSFYSFLCVRICKGCRTLLTNRRRFFSRRESVVWDGALSSRIQNYRERNPFYATS